MVLQTFSGSFCYRPLDELLSPEEIARQQEEAHRCEVERNTADERARVLLRAAGPEGEQLADGDGVLIPSKQFPQLTYGIAPVEDGKVLVFDSRIGSVGDICIQSEKDAPTADVLLTRLKLCQSDEEKLWRIGNFDGTEYDIEYFLPKQIRVWMKGNNE